MQDQSLFNYEGMENAAAFYAQKSEEILSLVDAIKKRNDTLVTYEWNGDSALAFKDRFDNDHAKKMADIAKALEDISSTIRGLVESRRQWEQDQAGKFNIG